MAFPPVLDHQSYPVSALTCQRSAHDALISLSVALGDRQCVERAASFRTGEHNDLRALQLPAARLRQPARCMLAVIALATYEDDACHRCGCLTLAAA
jgi:hypothetical protein